MKFINILIVAIWKSRQAFRAYGQGNKPLQAVQLPISHNNVVGENTVLQLSILETGVLTLVVQNSYPTRLRLIGDELWTTRVRTPVSKMFRWRTYKSLWLKDTHKRVLTWVVSFHRRDISMLNDKTVPRNCPKIRFSPVVWFIGENTVIPDKVKISLLFTMIQVKTIATLLLQIQNKPSLTYIYIYTVYLRVLVEEFIPEQNTTQTICLIHG